MLDERDYKLMNTKSYKNQIKIDNELALLKIKCEHCGHTMSLIKKDRKICTHCGHWVYRTPEAKFKYKLKEKMIKNAKD